MGKVLKGSDLDCIKILFRYFSEELKKTMKIIAQKFQTGTLLIQIRGLMF
jgi:hypothetical protein